MVRLARSAGVGVLRGDPLRDWLETSECCCVAPLICTSPYSAAPASASRAAPTASCRRLSICNCLGNFDTMGPGHFGDDSSNNVLLLPLLLPLCCLKQPTHAAAPRVYITTFQV